MPCADVAQSVEHILGKDEVTGPIPVISSKKPLYTVVFSYVRRLYTALKKSIKKIAVKSTKTAVKNLSDNH